MVLSVFSSLKVLYFSKGVFRTFPNIDDVLFYAKIANGSIMNVWQDSNYSYFPSSAELNFLPVFCYVSVTVVQFYNKDWKRKIK